MSSSRSIGRQGIADFFRSMLAKEAHWYSIMLLTLDAESSLHRHAFPSLSSLLNIHEAMMLRVLQTCGLLRYKRGTGYIPVVDWWNDFIKEYMLDEVEVTHYSPIGRKKKIYIRIGSWIKGPRKTPAEIWSKALKGNVTTPRLRITSLGNEFAKVVGEMGIKLSDLEEASASEPSDDDGVSSESTIEEEDEPVGVEQPDFLPDKNDYPLLHSLFLINRHSKIDSLVAEIVKLHDSKTITYRKGNNTDGILLPLPSYRSLDKYSKHLSKRNAVITDFVSSIAKSTKSSDEDAAECLLTSFSVLYPDSFLSVAVKSGLSDELKRKKMDALSVEAMLTDSGINNNKARKLFKHMKRFFGRSLFAS
jgi:hypothetical protein